MPALLHLGISTTSGGLGVECLQPSLDVSGKLCVSSTHISLSSSVQVSGSACQRSTQTLILVAPCWMEAPLLPTILNMLGDIPWQCPIIIDLIMDALVGHVLKGLPYLHLSLWLLSNVCHADRSSLPQSVRQWWGQFEHLHQRSTSSVGRNGQVCVLQWMYQTMPYLPLN